MNCRVKCFLRALGEELLVLVAALAFCGLIALYGWLMVTCFAPGTAGIVSVALILAIFLGATAVSAYRRCKKERNSRGDA